MKKAKGSYANSGRKGVQYKLLVAVVLMSVIPFLVLAYIVTNYVFDTPKIIFQTTLIVLFALWLAAAGYILAKRIIGPIISLAVETKNIANGRYETKVLISRDDELGDIANAVNTMTAKIRGYIGELQEYSEKTASLNLQIHKKVLTLTNLMKLGDLISSGTEFTEIADFTTEKIAGELYGGFCAVFIRESADEYSLKALHNNSGGDISTENLGLQISSIEKFFSREEYLLVDSSPFKKPWQKELKDKLGNMNVVFFPIKINENIIGMITAGNLLKGTKFEEDNIDMLRAFEKEIGLAYQSSQIFKRVKSLEIVDNITGLYTLSYLKERLNDEINRAVYYQRPCSLIMVEMDDFEEYSNYYGEERTKQVLRQVGKVLSRNIPSVGKIARSDDGEFAILLPEINKKGSLEIAEEIRKKIEDMKISSGTNGHITVSIGVSENPIDGVNAKDIVEKARYYADKAKKDGKNKVLGQ